MAVFVPAKRVTAPLNDKVKARLRGDDHHLTNGYSTSGSEHDAADDEPSCLSGLVHAFLHPDSDSTAASDHDKDPDDETSDRSVPTLEIVRNLLNPTARKDPFRLRLASDVSNAAETLAELRPSGSGYRRAVMGRLREAGYNAGICKARWESCGGVTAGSYEYIDVVGVGSEEGRYIVDVEFAAEFEIARATEEYGRVAAALPRVMVGKAEEVRQVVRVVADAARRSMRTCGLHVPPWRKSRYMIAKWLGPYRRTVNHVTFSSSATVSGGGEIKCRAVGFNAVGGVVIPPATRIR